MAFLEPFGSLQDEFPKIVSMCLYKFINYNEIEWLKRDVTIFNVWVILCIDI